MNIEFSKNKELSYNILKERYLTPIKDNPKLFIGIELEFPIVETSGAKTDTTVSKKLILHLMTKFNLEVVKKDRNDNIIHLLEPITKDEILFEVSYNTLEIAFGKAKTLLEIDQRFHAYLSVCQDFLKQFNHAIQGIGINPQWEINDNRAVALPRYEMLIEFLKMGTNYNGCHPYPDYASFICSSQAQFDVSTDNYLRILNLFNLIEPVKAYLFANSSFPKGFPDLSISRDRFWEDSMHGFFPENVGLYPKNFTTSDEWLAFMLESAMFYVERDGEVFYFEPIRVKDYLDKSSINAFDLRGNKVKILPKQEDFEHHRSYHYQVLTTRGTVEFRSICTQSLDRTFLPAAFHLGLLENLDEMESIVSASFLSEDCQLSLKKGRQYFSHHTIDDKAQEMMENISQLLLDCSRKGLLKRGFGEEKYLEVLKK